MALANDLAALGMAPELALLDGFNPVTQAGVGTAQGGSVINEDTSWVNATTAGGQTAFTLPSAPVLYKPYVVRNTSSTTALVFPATGGAINAAGANNSVNVAQNLARIFIAVSATAWVSWVAA